jgi:hypothetical protein
VLVSWLTTKSLKMRLKCLILCIFRIHFLVKLRKEELVLQERFALPSLGHEECEEATEFGETYFFPMVESVANL